MTTALIIAAGILGIIVGSFLNVVIFRFHTGRSLGGRSHCMTCKKTLSWYELIPLFSFLAQGGKCRSCKAAISPQYFAVEFLTGMGFAIVTSMYAVPLLVTLWAIPPMVFGFILVALFMVIAVYDARHLIMPDTFVVAFIILAALQLFFPFLSHVSETLIQLPGWGTILAGIIIPLPFLVLWFLSKGRWLGFGDIKFMIGIGWLLGIWGGITAIMFAFWIGTLWILFVYSLRSIMTFLSTRGLSTQPVRRIMNKEIPFAPFLIIATFIVFVTKFNLILYLLMF